MKRVKINKDTLEIKWRTPTRDEFQCILERIKTLKNRVFDPDRRMWICSNIKENRDILTKLGFFVPQEDKTVLIQPKKVDIKIKSVPGVLKELRHYQIEGINFIDQNKGRALLADDMGLGKGHPESTKMLTPTGWKVLSKIKKGDKVIGSEGTPITVTGVHHRGLLPVYRVIFNDKTSILTDKEHLWAVRTATQKMRNGSFQIKSTGELKSRLTDSSGNHIWQVPLVKPIQFRKQKNFIHPYLLGVILGDGAISQGTATVTPGNYKIIARVKEYLPKSVKIKLVNDNPEKCPTYRFVKTGNGTERNSLIQELRKLNLMGKKSIEKFIPESYLFSSVEDRIELLRGLTDTDSWQSKDVYLEYYTSSERLAKDVVFLIQSLGGIARLKIKKFPKYRYKEELRTGQPSYRIGINLPPEINPYKAFEKEYLPKTKYFPNRIIRSIKREGTAKVICISVDAKDKLYVTENCIVTHNTIQALAWLYHNKDKDVFPAIVVCPASAKFVWEQEIAESLKDRPSLRIIHGRKSGFFHCSTDIVVINYDILKDRLDEILRMNPKTLIGDEVHACKNTTTQRTKAFVKLGKVCKHIIALSGTPLEIRPIELFPVINLLRPDIFPDHHKYGEVFCEGYHDGYQWRYTGASNIPKLHNILTSTFMIRRKKSEVLKELPPKQRTIVPFEIDNRKDYKAIEKDVVSWILMNGSYRSAMKASRAEEFVRTRTLMTAAFLGKEKAVVKWVEDFLETDEKLIIFFATHYALDSVYTKFKDIAVSIDGRVPASERGGIVKAFQENKDIKLFCGEIVSAGQAITLTASSNVAFAEYLFNPAKHVQAEDRSNRLGQRNAVTVHYLVATDTIEETMIRVLQKRMEVTEGILDGETSDSNVFEEVIAQITEGKEKPNKFTRIRQRKLWEHKVASL